MTSLLLTEIFPPRLGGSGRWLAEVYSRFEKDVIVVADADIKYPDLFVEPRYVRRLPYRFTETGGFSPVGCRNYLRLLKEVRRLGMAQNISSVQTARVVPEGWIAWLWRRVGGPPYQCFAHGEEINLAGAKQGGVMSSRQHRLMAKLVLAGAERIVANSENTAAMLTDQWRVNDQKIRVVTPGVDASYFVPAERCCQSRKQLEWNGSPVLLSVGRLQKRKGHDRVIEALRPCKVWHVNLE